MNYELRIDDKPSDFEFTRMSEARRKKTRLIVMLRDIKIMAAGIAAMLAIWGCSYDGEVDESNGPAPGKGAGTDPGRMFGISVGGSSYSAPATRAEYDGVTYRWTPGDRVGFYMVPEGGSTPVVSNARLKSVNTAASQVADFEGELMERDIERIVPDGKYDYYSYYPYDAATDVGFPNVAFNIPGEMTLTPDVFPVGYGFMVANRETTADGEKPLTWIEQSTGQQRFGKYVGFEYRHVFAYLEVYLKVNLMSQPVTKMVVRSNSGALSGTAHINVTNGAVSFPSGSNSLTVNIGDGGLVISGLSRIWIPINPALAGTEFQVDFYAGTVMFHSETITGGVLQRGMKHKAGFKLPFHVDFSQNITRLGDANGMRRFESFGHIITANDRVSISESSLQMPVAYWAFGDYEAGFIKLPELDRSTNPNYTPVSDYVRIKVEVAGPRSASIEGYRRLNYAGIDANTNYGGMPTSNYFQLPSNTGLYFHEYDEADGDANNGRYNVRIGGNNRVAFRGAAGTAGYNLWLRKIWVYPNFEYTP